MAKTYDCVDTPGVHVSMGSEQGRMLLPSDWPMTDCAELVPLNSSSSCMIGSYQFTQVIPSHALHRSQVGSSGAAAAD